MHLEHSFSVAAGVGETWRAMLDPERMAKCIPGAALDGVHNGVASGAIRVRLGSIGPTYRGTATVVERDDGGHRAVVQAEGGSRSNGTATVRLVVTLSEFGEVTNVMLQSDVELTGRTGELGEQLISEAGDRLCRQVAARLNDLLSPPRRGASEPPVPEPPAPEPATADPAPEPPVTDVTESPAPTADAGPARVEPPAPEPPATETAEPPRRRPSPYPRPADTQASAPAVTAPSSAPAGSSPARVLVPVGFVVLVLLLRRRRRRRRARR